MEQYPIYEAYLQDGDEIQLISLVDKPAIERDFVAFSQEEVKQLQYFNEEQQIIVAPVMIPDKLILRNSDALGYFYTRFSRNTIEKIRYQYSKDGNFNNANLNHKDSIDGLVMLESWIKESKDDKSNNYGFSDLPNGTWFVKYKVDNKEVWQKIKEGKINGVSIEGYISYAVESFKKKDDDKQQSKGPARGKAGTPMYNQPNRGYLKAQVLALFGKAKFEDVSTDVFGYQLKYPYLSPQGLIVFKYLKSLDLSIDDQGMVRSSALQLDAILALENKAKIQNSISNEEFEEAVLLVDDFKDLMNEISRSIGIGLDASFIDNHLEIIKSFLSDEEFVILPKAGETKDQYVSRCVAIEINNGYASDQAAAICYDKWNER